MQNTRPADVLGAMFPYPLKIENKNKMVRANIVSTIYSYAVYLVWPKFVSWTKVRWLLKFAWQLSEGFCQQL